MPRVSAGAGSAVPVPGIYGDLLEREKRRCGYPEIRVTEHGEGFSRRPRLLLDALLGGRDVIVVRRSVEVLDGRKVRFPWDRSVRSVRVSPNDVVRPTEEQHPWYGRAADDVEGER